MKHFIGIDFGTSNTSISYIDKKGNIQLLKYNNMNIIPSVISFNDKIKCGINIDKNNILREFKTKIMINNFSFKELNINQILIIFFKYLRNIIETKLGKSNQIEIIASVPSNFNDSHRKLIKKCYIKAGFKVNRLINEPTAAALSFGLENTINDELILVVDIGGGTTDFSILEIDEGFFEVIDSYGINEIGGVTINKKLKTFLRKKLKGKYEYNNRSIELIKRKINILGSFSDNNIEINTRTFEIIILDIIIKYEEMFNIIKSKHKIEKIIMVGGGSNMKVIHELIIRCFGNIIIPNPDLNYCVSKGCCYYLGNLHNLLNISSDITIVDVNPLSLGVELTNGNFSIIIPKNSPLPTTRTQRYYLDDPNLTEIIIKIYQGERKIAKENIRVGIINYKINSKSINAIISITFKLTSENIIIITIIDETNNSKIDYTLENKIDYTFIEEHLITSLEHFHEDLKLYKRNEKVYLTTVILENKINNINNNINIKKEKKQLLLNENFKILDNITSLSMNDLDNIINNNIIIKENSDNVPESNIDIELKIDMINNRKNRIKEIMDDLILLNELNEEEDMYFKQLQEVLEIDNINTIELDSMINTYNFIKRKNYQEEFNYLLKYLKNNLIDFELSNIKKETILKFIEKCQIEVIKNKEYKKYIKKINNFCEMIYNQ